MRRHTRSEWKAIAGKLRAAYDIIDGVQDELIRSAGHGENKPYSAWLSHRLSKLRLEIGEVTNEVLCEYE